MPIPKTKVRARWKEWLAHEIEIDVVPIQVKQAINNLGQGIRDLGVNL